jgi:outer membrane murein-binding lipoprotein Lpp
MGSDSGLWGAVVAAIGLIGAIYTGRRGPGGPKGEITAGAPAEVVEISGQLQVSPAIWQDMQAKITKLEQKVDHLTDLMEQGATRENRMRELLRTAMGVIRRANRRLDAAGQPEEPVPADLTPYG